MKTALAQTGHFKGRSKHFDLRLKWVVDMMDLGLFKLDHVPSPDQHADFWYGASHCSFNSGGGGSDLWPSDHALICPFCG